jgi:hypothetical protein
VTSLFLLELSEPAINHSYYDGHPGCAAEVQSDDWAAPRGRDAHTFQQHGFSLREPGYEVEVSSYGNTPEEKANVMKWANVLRDNMQPFSHGLYVNQLSDTSGDVVRAGFGSNYGHLVQIKKKFDPTNVLRLNPNIKPDRPPSSSGTRAVGLAASLH